MIGVSMSKTLGIFSSVILGPLSAFFVSQIFVNADAKSPVWFFILAIGFVPGIALSALIASLDEETSYRDAFNLCGVIGAMATLASCVVWGQN